MLRIRNPKRLMLKEENWILRNGFGNISLGLGVLNVESHILLLLIFIIELERKRMVFRKWSRMGILLRGLEKS